MGYRHIDNLYKDQRILAFRECWALEKIHGTSAHVRWAEGQVWLHSGGEKAERFATLFDVARLAERFVEIGHPTVIVYGEAYGGKQQGQSWRYGQDLKFVAFEVQVGESWLDVPNAHDVAARLCIEFVHYRRIPVSLDAIDSERDAPSEQAIRNGMGNDKRREGVVLRPITEFRDQRGDRVICKHKRDEERETTTPRQVVDPAKFAVLQEANAIAEEWVTPTRLEHVLDKLPGALMEQTRDVIAAMVEDVLREGAGELVNSREARAAIGKKTAELFRAHLRAQLERTAGAAQ
jgi:hypothetical protein